MTLGGRCLRIPASPSGPVFVDSPIFVFQPAYQPERPPGAVPKGRAWQRPLPPGRASSPSRQFQNLPVGCQLFVHPRRAVYFLPQGRAVCGLARPSAALSFDASRKKRVLVGWPRGYSIPRGQYQPGYCRGFKCRSNSLSARLMRRFSWASFKAGNRRFFDA